MLKYNSRVCIWLITTKWTTPLYICLQFLTSYLLLPKRKRQYWSSWSRRWVISTIEHIQYFLYSFFFFKRYFAQRQWRQPTRKSAWLDTWTYRSACVSTAHSTVFWGSYGLITSDQVHWTLANHSPTWLTYNASSQARDRKKILRESVLPPSPCLCLWLFLRLSVLVPLPLQTLCQMVFFFLFFSFA